MVNIIQVNALLGRNDILSLNGLEMKGDDIYYIIKNEAISGLSVDKGLFDIVMQFCRCYQMVANVVSISDDDMETDGIPFPYIAIE